MKHIKCSYREMLGLVLVLFCWVVMCVCGSYEKLAVV